MKVTRHIPARRHDENRHDCPTYWAFDVESLTVSVAFGFGQASIRITVQHLLTGMDQLHAQTTIAVWPDGVEVRLQIGDTEEAIRYSFPRGAVERFVSEVVLPGVRSAWDLSVPDDASGVAS